MTESYIEALVQKYANGSATPEEVQQLLDWYHAAPVGEVVWPDADKQERERVQQRIWQRLQRTMPAKRDRLYWLTPLRAAAMLVVVLGVAALFYFWQSPPITYATVTNPSGQIKQVQLPDGSTVWLNAATTLKYANAFTQHRQMQLDGEAFFDVTHNPSHPFTVESGGVQVAVLGTRFNISGYTTANHTTVSLFSGKVSVTADKKALAVLRPGTQLEWDHQTKEAITKPIDTTAVVAWKAGKLQFQGQSLDEIMLTLEWWFNVRIRFADASLSQCRYYMSFDSAMPLKDILALMSEITQLQFSINQQNIVIAGRGCQ